jgi:hypothetical protein
MTTQGSLEPRTNKSTTPKKRDNDGSDRNDRNHGGRGQGRGFNTGGRGGRGRGGRGSGRGNGGGRNNAHSQQRGRNNERSTGKTDPNDPCPIHNGSHLWRKCVYNPNADSDAPQLRQYRNQQLSNPAGGRGQSDNRRVSFAPVNSYFVGQPTSYYMGPPTGTVVSGFGNPGGPNSSAGLYGHQPQNVADANALVDYALATSSYALRSSSHRSLGASPGAVTFHRDMLIDVPYVANMLLLRDKRQTLIDYNLRRENNRRRTFDYQVGQDVLELIPKPNKLGHFTKGPYRIEQVHTNGTITIRRSPTLTDRINIRRVKPFL